MQKTIFAAAAAMLTCAGACLAQPAGITPEMIGRSLPLEGAPLAVPGMKTRIALTHARSIGMFWRHL
jgi:hypothetical protein